MAFKVALLCLTLFIITLGTADACPCPRVYWPVCGSDGITYSNIKCMRCHKPNLRVISYGPCELSFDEDSDASGSEQDIYSEY